MTAAQQPDIDDLVLDPTRHYAHPQDVLHDERLDLDQKRRVLRSWVLDAGRLSESEGENMPGAADERSFLREAKLALMQLER